MGIRLASSTHSPTMHKLDSCCIMEPMARSGYTWAIKKDGPRPLLNRGKTEYPHHKRAARVYSQWLSGYSEEEIATFFELTVDEVERDIQHTSSLLSQRTVIAHHNDRNRILTQRAEGARYRKLLRDALATPVEDYLEAGIAPGGVLKEYREAVGMTEKPGGIRVNIANTVSSRGVSCSEDLLRLAISKLDDPHGSDNTRIAANVKKQITAGQETSIPQISPAVR